MQCYETLFHPYHAVLKTFRPLHMKCWPWLNPTADSCHVPYVKKRVLIPAYSQLCHHSFVLPLHLQKDTLENYKCGADFLPSPLASKPKFALEATAVLTKSGLLTAVAAVVENDYTIAFLGNNQGEVFKVELSFHSLTLLTFLCFFTCGNAVTALY